MWAAVPLIPVVVILPLIDWSAATVIVPLPVALVVTGGTSWPPLSTTLTSTAEATLTPIARRVTITPSIAQNVRLIVCLLSIRLRILRHATSGRPPQFPRPASHE